MRRLRRGDKVRKTGGDYTFTGRVAGVITKLPRRGKRRTLEKRVVVQDSRGLLLIMNPKQLKI